MSSDYQINIDAQAIQDSALEFNEIYKENEKLEAQKREQELAKIKEATEKDILDMQEEMEVVLKEKEQELRQDEETH